MEKRYLDIKDGLLLKCDCQAKGEIIIPDNVTRISHLAFHECAEVQNIVIPDSVISIGERAFLGCVSMKGIVIPASVKDVGPGIFDDCDALIKITVDPANRYYDSRGDCNSVIDSNTNTLVAGCGTSVIPDTVEYIGKKAFINCRMLKAISP